MFTYIFLGYDNEFYTHIHLEYDLHIFSKNIVEASSFFLYQIY